MKIKPVPFTPQQSAGVIFFIAVFFASIIMHVKSVRKIPPSGEFAARLKAPEVKVVKSASIDELLKVTGGQSIEIKLDEPSTAEKKETKVPAGKVNINQASKQELMRGLQIPARTAEVIVEYREKVGEIWELEELLGLPGIDETLINKIRRKVIF